jgi:hypothetical protein
MGCATPSRNRIVDWFYANRRRSVLVDSQRFRGSVR